MLTERRKRWSDSWKGVSASEDEDETDTVFKAEDDPKLKAYTLIWLYIATLDLGLFLREIFLINTERGSRTQ